MSPDAERSGGSRRGLTPVAATLLLLAVVFVAGPRPDVDDRWMEPRLPASGPELSPAALDEYLTATEAAVPDLRPGDAKGIVWADDETPARTPASLVYLHGFSADRHEIEPVVSLLGASLGANVYFTRLTGHGRDGAAMEAATAADWLDDTAEAVAVGAAIGERVVVIGTSTGGTLASWAAMRPESHGRIDALVLVSPNFQPKDRSSRVLLYPWGGTLARLLVGPERCFEPENDAQERHWTTCYPTSSLLPMMALVEHVRTMSLEGWGVPTLLVYAPEDRVVDAQETERVLASLPGDLLRVHVVAETGDPASHVLAGDVLSPETNQELHDVIASFVRDILGD